MFSASKSEKSQSTMVSERILEEVRGRMMEELVLLETFKSANDVCYIVAKILY